MQLQKRTAAERAKLVEMYRNRDQATTRKEFCRIHNLPLTTLDSWLRHVRENGRQKLVAVEVTSNSGHSAGNFTIILANGRRIEAGWQFTDAELSRLIRVAEKA